ncbi:putative ABC transport system ATP-binding protein [Sulfuritortus calidifontis]|uniref:Putative ABC transport system ATP-binding protein n=1 Tax=Sulfuritortus calidifontis TaxID=1914471 RepID=A0A4R3JXL8_9PROT|nr:ABC transporter ATP-binding protein [Sulfuritortus calidifontis]TCS73085.1 putative ABC transport system ATP-binding protein [Sulfuritortus calidifontis]
MASLIRVEHLSKTYLTGGREVPVLHGIDLAIEAGEFVAIMGPSGSGKSTFMNILGCLDVPSHGRYLLDGRDVSALSADELATVRNRSIGFVFQGFNLLKRVSALDNVALPLLYAGVGRAERRRRAEELLRSTGLEAHADSLPNQMSGGQQQRVAIARALINRPPLILADEPTGNLDSYTSHEIMDLLARLNREQGITIVLVTHEHDIARYGRRLVRFVDGRIVEDGGPA